MAEPNEKNKFDLAPLTQAELNEIIRKHQMFLTARPGGARALVRDRDLTGLSFIGQNLSQSDFTGCIMARADLTNANFESATLFGCDFHQAKMTNARLVRADLRGADIAQAQLTNADLTGADLREGKTILKRKIRTSEDQFSQSAAAGAVQFKGSDLSGAVLTGAMASGADFTDAVMVDTSLQGATLRDAILTGTDLSQARLSGADLRNADFSYALLSGTDLEDTEQFGSIFSQTLTDTSTGTDITEFELTLDELILRHINWVASGGRHGKRLELADVDMRKGPGLSGKKITAAHAIRTTFAGMDLRGIEMQSALLEHSDFRKCLMDTADLRGANLRGCLMSRASLRKAQLGALTFKKPDGSSFRVACSFEEAILRQVDFSGSMIQYGNFVRADLTGADFSHCDLRHADFRGARLEETRFEGALLDHAEFDT